MLIVIVIVSVVVMAVQSRIGQRAFFHWLPQLVLEKCLDAGILVRSLDLLDFQRNSETLRKVTLGDRPITSFGIASIEVLVIPEIWRRHDRSRLPIDLDRLVLVGESLAAGERESLPVERQ